jgi:hypothetical protein
MVLKESSLRVNDRGFRSDSISVVSPLVWLLMEGGILYAFIRGNATLEEAAEIVVVTVYSYYF